MKFHEWEEQKHKELARTERKELIIETYCEFENDKLVLKQKDYPKLKFLYAIACGLTEAKLYLPNLEVLWINDNQLETFDFTNLSNLKTLVISGNQIKDLDILHLEKLETLWCFGNRLEQLDCSNLEKLEDLNCAKNIYKSIVGEDGKTRYFGMEYLHLDGCSGIKHLDCDLNGLDDLDFSDLVNLRTIVVRQNNLVQVISTNEKGETINDGELYGSENELILNSPYLETVDYSISDVTKVVNREVVYNPENPKSFLDTLFEPSKFKMISNVPSDEGYSSDDKKNDDCKLREQSKYQKSEWEQRNYERQQQKEKEAFEKGEHVWAGQEQLDLSNRDYINSITIDGNVNYPQSLVSINLGGNYLSEVIVRNMPNLVRLIISHNSVDNLVIENCPKLSIIYDYKSGDKTRKPPENAREYNEKTDNSLRIEQDKILKQIIGLIFQAEEALAKGDYKELARLLTEIKELAEKKIEGINKDKLQASINRFEQALLTKNINVPNKGYQLVMVIGVISLMILIISLFLVKIRKISKK